MMSDAELTNYCWEKLRDREFYPYGKEWWSTWVFHAPRDRLIALAALLDDLAMNEAAIEALVHA